MAAAIVGEALLSASVEFLLDKIISREFVDFFRRKKLDLSLIQKLKITLLSLQAVLNDAEEKQITNSAVRKWLDELKDAVFDTDDLFDEINTEALRWKVEAEPQGQTFSAKVSNFLSSPFKRRKVEVESQSQTIIHQVLNFISSPFKEPYEEINSKMLILFERLEQFAQNRLGLKEGVSGSVWHGTPTSSVVDELAIYGRDDDRRKLKDYFLSEDVNGSKIGVVSIVGMGGVGKTTLAKLLFNDSDLNQKFDVKAWAYISKEFDVCKVTKTILESVTSETISTDNLNILQGKLKQSLSYKRFLLVLDDIWDGSYVEWNNLMDIFNAGEIGSRIIVTTRDESVALAMQTFLPIHYLRPIESEDCWSLLAKHAFGASNNRERSNLEVIGREITKNCGGLPLAAIALGGLLRTKSLEDDWKKVLKSNIWDLPNVNVHPALLLSYQYLPAALKQCFAYCSIFPKNSELDKRTIVQLWIAEGLVHQSKSEKSMEEVGDEYFDELVSRSLIHRQSVDGKASFEMHDLINDLATMVSSSYCIRLDEWKLHENLDRVRHLSYNRGEFDSFDKFDTLYGLKGLRTFLALPLQEETGWQVNYLSNKVILDLLPSMKQLRVLSLVFYESITELPDSIGNLIHLRYLNLSGTCIKRLPSIICKLYNLQTLLLCGCRSLIELPEDMGKLINLRHLDISNTSLQEMPIQIAKIQNLQTLSDFFVSGQQDGLKVAELRKFSRLQGKLSISGLENVTEPTDASQANLKMKKQIDEMTLRWCQFVRNTQASQIETLVFEQLLPSTNLKNLTIHGYSGSSFPNWLGDSSFGNMVYLCIINCHHCSSLPPLGQLLSLKELKIEEMRLVKSVGAEFYGSSLASFQPFPSLETLSFSEMPEWEEWNLIAGTAAEFPRLSHLSLSNCPKLKGNIPSKLLSLTELELRDCPLLESGNSDDNNSNIVMPSNIFSQMMSFNSLRKLTINGFPSLKSFPRDGLPKTLQSLDVDSCVNLEFLPQESLQNYTSLDDLKIYESCYSMTSFTLGSLPVLKSLHLGHCKNLKSILVVEDVSQSLSFLRSIRIWDCNELESFSHLPAPNLIFLEVNRCEKLNSLAEPINTLTGLQVLSVYNLPNMQSFAKEGLPINLRGIQVGQLGGILSNTKAITKWSLERLPYLLDMYIGGDDLVNTLNKMDVQVQPTSLVSLKLQNIKCLDGKWLQHLTSLQQLKILHSPSLKSLPEEGLPSSLSILEIVKCPLLKASFQKNRGKEWGKIAHIPFIKIDSEIYSS